MYYLITLSRTPNALRVITKTAAGTPMRSLFGRLMGLLGGGGYESYQIQTQSSASILPRQIVFAIDLSSSIHFDTHVPRPFSTQRGVAPSYYAYYRGEVPCPAVFDYNDPGINGNVTDNDTDAGMFAGLANSRPVNNFNPFEHFKNEHVCVNSTATEQDNSNTIRHESWVLDKGAYIPIRNAALDPQPLSAVLSGINSGLQNIRTRAVSGDTVGFVGFDDGIINQRVKGMAQPDNNDPAYVAMFEATNLINSPDDPLRLPYFLFPRFYGSRLQGSARLGAASNLKLGLNQAVNILKLDQGSNPRKKALIIMFTDGLANCLDSGVCQNGNNDPLTDQILTQSQNEMMSFINSTLIPNSISFSLFLFGETSKPHTLVLKAGGDLGPANRCVLEKTARLNNKPFINSTGASLLTDGFTYQPNRLYESVVKTGGTFQPFRPCCDNNCADVRNALDNICDTSSQTTGNPIICPGSCYDVNNVSNPSLIGCSMCRFTDRQGRLLCDPAGKGSFTNTTSRAISDAINNILNQSDFILVD